MRTKFWILCLLSLFVVGCAKEKIVTSGSDIAAVELSEAAVAINQSLQVLAENDQADTLKVKPQALNPNAYGMGRLASVDWHGPAEPLIKRIAALTQYRLKVFGKQPALPILVSVSEREQYIGDVLRQVSLQSKDQIKLLVYPSNKLIELHYLRNDR